MARPRKTLPDDLAALAGYGRGTIALTGPHTERGKSLTRAERALVPDRLRDDLGLKAGKGRPAGSSPYALDQALVERTIRYLVANPAVEVQAAARMVRRALIREPQCDEAAWIANGWLSYREEADVERISDKTRPIWSTHLAVTRWR